MEDEEFLTKCVVDPVKRTFYLYSSEGDEKQIDCNNVEEFISDDEIELELIANELRGIIINFDGILGLVDTERVLGEIFSNFCIGK